MEMRSHSSKIRHSISSLGVRKVTAGEIRVERLETRLDPLVPFPHRHDFFQICWVAEGQGWHEIDFKKYILKSRQLFVMKPGQVHSWDFKEGTTGFLIEFTFESLSQLYQSKTALISLLLNSPDMVQVSGKKAEEFVKLISMMKIEFKDQEKLYEWGLQALLEMLLVQIARFSSTPAVVHTDLGIAAQFSRLVEENYNRQHRVEYYAERLGMTSKALTMRLARLLKRSPRSLIQDRLLLEAKRLLLLSNRSIAEISEELGIEDANYFSRLFRAKVKMTPSEFRTQVRE